METLGKTLRRTRQDNLLTSRDVALATGISSSYLSQIENDKIQKPSANILYKLAELYRVDIKFLLHAAGIIEDYSPLRSSLFERELAYYKDVLTEDEMRNVINYIKFLKHSN
jgi:HTH-type transcriptional regulator, competence development regulator